MPGVPWSHCAPLVPGTNCQPSSVRSFVRIGDPLSSSAARARGDRSLQPAIHRGNEGRDRRGRKRRDAAHVDLAQHVALAAVRAGSPSRKSQSHSSGNGRAAGRRARAAARSTASPAAPAGPGTAARSASWYSRGPGCGGGSPGRGGIQRIDRLQPEAGDAVLDQVGAHHALGQARLPGLVDHVAAVPARSRAPACPAARRSSSSSLAAALRVPHAQRAGATAGSTLRRARRRCRCGRGTASARARRARSRAGRSASSCARLSTRCTSLPNGRSRVSNSTSLVPSFRIASGCALTTTPASATRRSSASSAIAPPPALDRVAPDEHHGDVAQLRFDLLGEVVVVHGGHGGNARGGKGLEQGSEPALGRVGAIAQCAVSRIEQGNGRMGHRRQRPGNLQAGLLSGCDPGSGAELGRWRVLDRGVCRDPWPQV